MAHKLLGLGIIISLLAPVVRGQSSDPRVVSGTASFQQSGANWTITTSDQAVINWQCFDVPAGTTMQFVQPGAGSLVVNRVIGPAASYINGLLTANGRLYLINPHGITVGPTGIVRVNGFIASTLNASNAAMLSGGQINFVGISPAAIENFGRIEAIGGDIYLVAAHVSNQGTISAPGGKVGLAAGNDVLLTHDKELFVRPTHLAGVGGTGIDNNGLVEAVSVELKAHGNMYDLAINTSGVVRAAGFEFQDGRVVLRADGGTVTSSGVLAAKTVDDQGRTTGGEVQVLGREVHLADTSVIDVSGDLGGGKVNIGGSFQGKGPLPNAEKVSVDAGARIAADAIESGDGGCVIVWADGTTDFAGLISARAFGASGDGGFAEVSGRASLDYTGLADLRAAGGLTGTLLLDPTDFTVGAGEAATIVTNLATSNVVVSTNSGGGGNGDIFIKSEISYSSGNDLTFLAHRHIRADASVQNASTGQVNLVAGWNGTTGAPGASGIWTTGGAFGMAAILADPNSYGNNSGSVYVNKENGKGKDGVAVGSFGGGTSVAAWDVILQGGSKKDAYAQLGFEGSTGAIWVTARADVTIQGGSSDRAYAQLGHGAYNLDGAHDGNHSGDLDVTAQGALTIQGGSKPDAYAQLGHGGYNANGNHSGDFTVTAQAVTIQGGSRDNTYAQLGHGGPFADGNHSGNLDVTAQTLTLQGGSRLRAYAQLGHGGFAAGGNHSGYLDVTVQGAVTIEGGSHMAAYAQLGHGGYNADGNHSGDLTVTAQGALTIQGGSNYWFAYGQLGHGGHNADGNHSGDLTVTTQGALTIQGGSDWYAYGQLGHGGAFAVGDHWGDLGVTAQGALTIQSGSGERAYVQIGHGGYDADGNHSGTIDVVAEDMLTILSGVGGPYAMIGLGDFSLASGTRQGDVSVRCDGLMTLGQAGGSWWIGHRTTSSGTPISDADVSLTMDSLTVDGSSGPRAVTITGPFGDMLEANLAGGDVTVATTATGISDGWIRNNDTAFSYNSIHRLTLHARNGIELPESITNSGSGVVVLHADVGGVNQTGGTLTADELLLLGSGDFILDQANNVDMLAANITGPLTYTDADGLTVGEVGGIDGIDVGNNDVTLNTAAGGVNQTEALTAGGLLLLGGGDFDLDHVDNDVDTLAANITGPLTYTDTDGLTVGTVDGTNGIDVGNNDVTLNTTAGGVNQTEALTAGGLLLLGGGGFDLDHVDNDVDTLAAAITGVLTYTDTDGLTVGEVGGIDGIATVGNAVTLNTGDTLTLAQDVTAAGARVTLNPTAGGVNQTGGILTAGELLLLGGGDFILDHVDNDVGTLAADINGPLTYTDWDGLAVDTVDGINGIATVGNDVTLTADDLDIQQPIDAGGAAVNLRPLTLARQIDLGTETLGSLSLTDAELDLVTAGVLRVGRDAAGNVDVSDAIAPANTNTLTLLTVGAIGGSGSVTATNLRMEAGGPVVLSGDVGTLAANVTGAGNGFTFTDTAGTLTIGSVDGRAGLTTNSGAVTLNTNTGQLILAENVTAGGARVTLNPTAGGVNQTGGTLTAAELLLLGGGNFILDQANNVDMLAANITGPLTFTDTDGLTVGTVGGIDGIDVGNNDVTLNTTVGGVNQTESLTAGGLLLLGGGDFDLDHVDNDVDTLAADINGALTYRDTDGLTVGAVGGTNGIDVGNNDVTLNTTAGGVNQTEALTAGGLLLLGGGGFILDHVDNDVDTLAAAITGPLTYTDVDGLTVGEVGGIDGIATVGNAVTLNTGDTLTLAQDVTAAGARVTLNTTAGGVNQTGGILTAGELLLLGGGDFILDHVDNDVDTLAANIASPLTYRDWNDLTVGTVGGVPGIQTHGGSVEINAPVGRITVNQPIDTTLGAGGLLTVTGDVVVGAALVLGAGDITLNARPLPGPGFPFGPPDQSGYYDFRRGQWVHHHLDELTYQELLAFKREVEELAGGDLTWAQLLTIINTYMAAVVSRTENATFYRP